MKKCFFAFVGLTFLQLNAQNNCSIDTSLVIQGSYQQQVYELVEVASNWHDAAACAVSRGGRLVEVNDSLEQRFLQQFITTAFFDGNFDPYYKYVQEGFLVPFIWIGANDFAQDGNWLWDGDGDSTGTIFWQGEGFAGDSSGVALSYVNWGKVANKFMEPDNRGGTQNALAMAMFNPWPNAPHDTLGSLFEWNDLSDTNSLYYIIEYPKQLSYEKVSNLKVLSVYPNPTNDFLTWDVDIPVRSVEIYDLAGNRVIDKNLKERNQINISTLSPGTYVFKVFGENKSFHAATFLKN